MIANNASNARYLSYGEIAASFVITANFERLLSTSHTFIMGPRGCGKTTMLKMLNPSAAIKCGLLDRIPFWGIYIPSDQQWRSQFDAVQYQFGDRDPQFAKRVSMAMFNINVLISYCETIACIWEVTGIEEGEETFPYFAELVSLWKLTKPIAPTLSSIVMRLRSYLMDIDEAVNNNNIKFSFPYVCSVNFTNLLVAGISAFEKVFYKMERFSDHKKWAICMDEMEIAPDWLLSEVLKSMRSIDQRLVFKVTAVPTNSIGEANVVDVTEGNDYDVIRVWNFNKQAQQEWLDFSSIMLKRMVLEPNNIDYPKLVDMISSYENNNYYHHSQQALNKVVEELKQIDHSFYDYARTRSKDFDKIEASDVKKSVMVFPYFSLIQRLKILKSKRSNLSNENRLYDVYMNPWLLSEYCDGNPRTLINFYTELNNLVRSSLINRITKTVDFPSFSQRLIYFTHTNIYNRLAYQSMSPILYKNISYSYKQILDAIGAFIFQLFAQESYNPTPNNLFTTSSSIFTPFIKTALESGALVLIDDSAEYRGVRNGTPVYRLNYGLYPYYHIVKTTSKHVIYLENIIDADIARKENENQNN